ncbi:MAG: cytochrome c peroxidase [Bacteroidota bacterium]
MNNWIKTTILLLALCLNWSCEAEEAFAPSEPTDTPAMDSTQDDNDETTTTLTDAEVLAKYLALPGTAFNYSNPNLPPYFTNGAAGDLDNTPNDNRIMNTTATLGRVLFYDNNLSANNTIACASCHIQDKGFSDPDQFSTGFDGGLTGRHSMSLANARYYENGRFFWDERAATLEDQVLMPIQDHVEMGMTLEELVTKLQAKEYYDILFTDAFGSNEVTSERISLALAQFVRSMVSYQSKYDVGLRMTNPGNPNQPLPNFTDLENLGLRIFTDPQLGGCAGCHSTPLQTGIGAQNNGLDLRTVDEGLGAVTGNPRDDGKFKSPSLRNIGVTGPYMHDGRFATLLEVVEHYNSGVQAHPNLDPRLRNGPGNPQPKRLNLSEQEKQALVAFLNTLTDEVFLTDEKFSDPFIN